MDKIQKTIKLWKGSTESRNSKSRGYSLDELAVMVRIAHESNGELGPWFESYAKRNDLL